MLKGALHCHTTRSDGQGEPGDVIRLHKQNGYDFMALTDHRRYNYENFAPETDMLIVPGMELDGNLPGGRVHCFHEVCIGPSRENGNGYAQDQRFETVRMNEPTEFQPTLDGLHANNNMTLYCHPQWSGTPTREFEQLRGNFAMEIWNTGCVMENDQDQDAAYWDEILYGGGRLWGVATDDGHSMDQHCRGWVMVNAKRDLDAILAALKDGAFYSSTGPEIYDFRIEDGMAVVDCSPCSLIAFHELRTPLRCTRGEGVTSGRTKVIPGMKYVRATVMDAQGRRAWTNPIFLDR